MNADKLLTADWMAPILEKTYRRAYLDGWRAAATLVGDDESPYYLEDVLQQGESELENWRDGDCMQRVAPPWATRREFDEWMAAHEAAENEEEDIEKEPLTYDDLVAKWGRERLDKVYELARTLPADQHVPLEYQPVLRDLGRSEVAEDYLIARIRYITGDMGGGAMGGRRQ